jgi:hypothetical protein
MKSFWNAIRQPRFFLSIVLFPSLVGIGDCPVIVDPPPPPNLGCQTNIPLMLQARKCILVEPPCFISQSWRQGDTYTIKASAINNEEPTAFNFLDLHINRISSGGTIMRQVCQSPYFSESYTNGKAKFGYTIGGNIGEGIYNVSISNHSALTVSIVETAHLTPAVYARTGATGGIILSAVAGGGAPPYSYQWLANGVILPGRNSDIILETPHRNTEYSVRVFDQNKNIATTATVVFVENASGDPVASFTVTPEPVQSGQQALLNPSGSTGNITRWEWDFEWQGDVTEPFDLTLIGPNGMTARAWNQPGRKYVRLRVTTASGNFHEIFQRVTVTPASVKQ